MVGDAFIVTEAVMEHPLVLVQVIVVVPAEIPVTNPVVLTEATPVLEETQGLDAAAVALPVNCVVLPMQADKVPVMVGKGFMVTTAVIKHPLVLV